MKLLTNFVFSEKKEQSNDDFNNKDQQYWPFFAEPGIWNRNVVVAAVWRFWSVIPPGARKNSSKYSKYTHRKLTNWYPPGNDHISPTSRHFWDRWFFFLFWFGGICDRWKHIPFFAAGDTIFQTPYFLVSILDFQVVVTSSLPSLPKSPDLRSLSFWNKYCASVASCTFRNFTTNHKQKHPSTKPRGVSFREASVGSLLNMHFMYRQHFQKKVDQK